MDTTILKKLGLDDKEAKVYLTLLEYGAISVRGLAEVSALNRGTAYDTLKRLQEIGLVSYYYQEKKQRFVAEDPERLLEILKKREQEIKEVKNGILDIIPELKSIQDKKDLKPVSKLYENRAGIKTILDDLLSSMETLPEKEREYYIYSSTQASADIHKAYPNFTQERIKRDIHVRSISLAQGGNLHGLDHRRWLGTDKDSATFILIYAEKCAFISRDSEGTPVGILVENKMIYETQKMIFLKLWDFLQ
ncbi:MAG: helix-turn-helix domain-containing protein [Parcubacteria group bacterium]|jgi:sugar-specific transcriptional regulator TrmB